MANINFDATTVAPQAAFEALPAGWYLVAIVGSESKPTKAGTGEYLELTLEVLEGDYKGRKVFDRLNLDNPNAQAVEISKATLSAICHAVGVLQPKDSTELHNLPLLAKVSVRDYQGEKQNEVKGYKAQGTNGSAVSANGNGAAKKPGGAKKKPAWAKRLQRDEAAENGGGGEEEGEK